MYLSSLFCFKNSPNTIVTCDCMQSESLSFTVFSRHMVLGFEERMEPIWPKFQISLSVLRSLSLSVYAPASSSIGVLPDSSRRSGKTIKTGETETETKRKSRASIIFLIVTTFFSFFSPIIHGPRCSHMRHKAFKYLSGEYFG